LAIATASAQHAHLLCRDADLRAATDSRSEAVLLERFDPNYREEAALLLAPGYELLKGHAALGPTRVYALAQTVCTAALTCDQIPIALEVCERGLWAHDRRLIGKAQFAAHLAQALWVDPSTQARARELMTDALSSLRRMGAGEGLVDPLQEWLESHAVAEPSPSL
jgi:hypothetical protein